MLRLLGPVRLDLPGATVDLGPAKQRCLMACLLMAPGASVPVATLIDRIWGDQPPRQARNVLSTYAARLRRAVHAAGVVELRFADGGYLADCDPMQVDLHRGRRLIEAARTTADPQTAIELLSGVLIDWQPVSLAGLAGDWAERVRAGLAEERLEAITAAAAVRLRLRQYDQVVRMLRELVLQHPMAEGLIAPMLVALARTGRQAEALEAFERLRRNLADELGTEPSAPVKSLHLQILRGELQGDEPQPDAAVGHPTAEPPVPIPTPRSANAAAVDGWADQEAARGDADLEDSGGGRAGPASAAGNRRAGERAALEHGRQTRFTLPADTMAFTGRAVEMQAIAAAVSSADQRAGRPAIHAIDGMPGVGKTALAVHAAHRLAEHFPDRQIFVDLHAHTADRTPTAPTDILAELLTGDGVDPSQLPDSLEGRAGMWRDRLARTRTLIVLDNAASTAQITPLLPGTPGCLVLVTSRRRLAEATATHVFLDILGAADAAALFQRLAPRAAGHPADVAEVVKQCEYLPLAIAIVAGLYRRRPAWTLTQLIAEIRNRRLTVTGEHHTVKAAFDVSYDQLPEARQRFFRLLGLHLGTEIDGFAAAALTGVPHARALEELDELFNNHLLDEPAYRRYRMHDLIREYARTQATTQDTPDVREHAVRRLLDYYHHCAAHADAYLSRHSRTVGAAPPAPAAAPQLDSWERSAAWLRTERPNLLSAINHAASHQLHRPMVGLTAAIAALLYIDGPWALAADLHRAAATAARRDDDQRAEAGALYDLGTVQWLAGDYPGAADLLAQAEHRYRAIGDRLGQANALNEMGGVRYLAGDYPGAVNQLEQALDLYRTIGDQRGEAYALRDLGNVRLLTGDYPEAARLLNRALELHETVRNPHGRALTLGELGVLRRLTGDYRGAADSLAQALNLYQTIGNRRGQGITQVELAILKRLTGDFPAAADHAKLAWDLHRAVGNPHGEAIAMTQLAAVRYLTADHDGADALLQQALAVLREVGAPDDEAETLNHVGTLRRLTGNPAQAVVPHRQALAIARDIHLPLEQARALEGLGRAALDLGNTDTALTNLRQALDAYQRLGVSDGVRLAGDLAELTRG